jgi:hypothetical protein
MASDRRWLGCAALVGALIAFPAGLIVGGREAGPQKIPGVSESNRDAGAQVKARNVYSNVYSPNITKDPYVLSEQRRVVEALEAECRHSGNHCAEAREARRWLRQQADPD